MRRKQQQIPNRLRRFRKIAGFTQTEVAKKLGMNGTDRISKWEKGFAIPNGKNLLRLSLLYSAFPHDFYSDYLPCLEKELQIVRTNDTTA